MEGDICTSTNFHRFFECITTSPIFIWSVANAIRPPPHATFVAPDSPFQFRFHSSQYIREWGLCQGFSFGGVGSDSAGDKIGKASVTRLIEGCADTGKHLLSGGTELGFGYLEGELFHFGFTDIAGLVFDFGRRCGFGCCFGKCDVVHSGPI